MPASTTTASRISRARLRLPLPAMRGLCEGGSGAAGPVEVLGVVSVVMAMSVRGVVVGRGGSRCGRGRCGRCGKLEAAAEGAIEVDAGGVALGAQAGKLLLDLQQRLLRRQHVELG